MQVRLSACKGMDILEEGTEEILGVIEAPLLGPDTGKVEGFFLHTPDTSMIAHPFIAQADIVRLGRKLLVRRGALSSVEDHIRLVPLLTERRTVLHQRIRTEGGKELGRCGDIQFDARHFLLTWLFPRKWFRFQRPIPANAIREVTPLAIIVREELLLSEEETTGIVPQVLPSMAEIAEA